jgi:hypothetical protein
MWPNFITKRRIFTLSLPHYLAALILLYHWWEFFTRLLFINDRGFVSDQYTLFSSKKWLMYATLQYIYLSLHVSYWLERQNICRYSNLIPFHLIEHDVLDAEHLFLIRHDQLLQLWELLYIISLQKI